MMPPRRFLPRVLDVAAPPRFEFGDDLPADATFDRVAVMAHFTARAELNRSVRTLVGELLAADYRVLIMSSSELAEPLRWPGAGGAPPGLSVYRRPNIGYDFGSWAAAMAAFPRLAAAERVLLCNDSLVGPFRTISPIMTRFDTEPYDIWGLMDSTHIAHHVQSYWVGYRGGVLAEPALRDFWQGIRIERSKAHIIKRYEVGAMRYWRRYGYSVGVGFPFGLVVNEGFNPASFGWRRLLDFGFPFVKREIATNPPPEIRDGDQVAAVIAEKFGEDVGEWL
ncbi:MAG: hypothetical protein KDC23_08685 [Actinobacteria bacterium]|nr:hypothetical protein [Actinomycetota bacterium]